MDGVTIDSSSVGAPDRYLGLEQLEHGLAQLAAPLDGGHIHLIVTRGEGGQRETPGRLRLTGDGGVTGDAWVRRGEANPEMQVAVMQRDVAALIANGQPLELFGDNLFLELDLSTGNLPTGSRVRIGEALLVVTPMPHNGCRKFRARFGDAALRFVSKPDLRHRNLRGIYMRVIDGGEVRAGDRVDVLHRADLRTAKEAVDGLAAKRGLRP